MAPALSSQKEGSYTLASALEELHGRTNVLHRFGIFSTFCRVYRGPMRHAENIY